MRNIAQSLSDKHRTSEKPLTTDQIYAIVETIEANLLEINGYITEQELDNKLSAVSDFGI